MSRFLYFKIFFSVILITFFVNGAVSWSPDANVPASKTIGKVYSGCGETKGCVVLPEDCTNDCSAIFTYKKLNSTIVELEVYGKANSNAYVAFGFSADRKMGDDSVVECVLQNYGPVNAFQSFNSPGEKNDRITPSNFHVTATAYNGGFIYCQVRHPIIYSLKGVNFDLNKEMYVLFAEGDVLADSTIREHDEVAVSEVKVTITDYIIVPFSAEGEGKLKQTHGALMVIAWLISGSIGLLMPRYMKRTWLGWSFYKKDMWFVYHQLLMCLTWILTIIGFILIFIDVGGWVSDSVSENPHPLIGCITTVLAFIQPIMAFFRPAPDASNRYIFNWAHRLVGYSAHILALTSIFLAVEMEDAHLPYYTYWVLTAYVVCYVIAQVVLTMLAHRNAKIVSELKYDVEEPGSSLRQAVLYAFVVVAVGLGFAVVGFIASD